MSTNNHTEALRSLRENERVSSLVQLFATKDDSPSPSQMRMLQEIGQLSMNEYGHFLNKEDVVGDFLPATISSYALGMVRMMNRDGVSNEVARKTFFGPWPSELVSADNPDDDEGIFPSFKGVTFIAITPEALKALDPSQKNEQDVTKLVVPKEYHQWQVVKKGRVVLSRISIKAPDDLMKCAEKVGVFEGDLVVVSLAALDPTKSDVVPKSTSILFGNKVLTDENIFQITEVPPGLEELALSVSVGESPTLGKVLDLLTLESYKLLDGL